MSGRYDAIVIGAGIGGLICSSYLAKAGLSVLVVEQHVIPGGYCTSFQRNRFNFDVGVHYLGGIKKGILGRILDELGLKGDLKCYQYDPVDTIIMPEHRVRIRAHAADTIEEFKKSFSKEKKQIKLFFSFLTQKDFLAIYRKVKGLTFDQLLNEFFVDKKLKATMSVFLGNIGVSPKLASAIASIILFREYLLDPGYYPQGGIQKLPDLLVEYIKKQGGGVIIGKKVDRIITQHGSARGVRLVDGKTIMSDIVISNADAIETFLNLLDTPTGESGIVKRLIPTPSMLLTYLGLDTTKKTFNHDGSNIYLFSSYNIHNAYTNYGKNLEKGDFDWIVCSFPSFHASSTIKGKDTMCVLTFAPFKSEIYWKENKERLSDKLTEKACKIIVGLRDLIDLKVSASPATLHRYTLNNHGAFAGWLPTCSQIKPKTLSQITSIDNLYLVGHWTAVGYLPFGGIPNVAFSGRRAARYIIEKVGKRWGYSDFYTRRA